MNSPLYPCDKPSSTGTHNQTAKKLTLSAAFRSRVMMESRPLTSHPSEYYMLFNRIESPIIFNVTIAIHKSRNLIGTLGNLQFGPK